MKRTIKVVALILALTMLLCSCGKKGFSTGLDEKGYFENLNASEYFDIANMDAISIPQEYIDDEKEYFTHDVFPAEKQITNRKINGEDTVNIDYVGYVDGVEFEGGSTGGEGTNVNIATTSYIDGFLIQLVGHKAGDEFDIKVTFPDPYENNTELSGKDAVFKTKVNYIVEYTPAEFTDEFVQNNLYSYFYYYYGVSLTTVAEYEDYLKGLLIEDYILDNCALKEGKEVPSGVQDTINNIAIQSLKQYAEKYKGVELVTYLKDEYDLNSEKEYLEKYADSLATQAQNAMLIQALSEYYGLLVSDDEVKEYFAGEEEGMITYDEAVEEYGVPYLKQYMLQDKVIDHVMELTAFE